MSAYSKALLDEIIRDRVFPPNAVAPFDRSVFQPPLDRLHFRMPDVILTRLVVEQTVVERKRARQKSVHDHAQRPNVGVGPRFLRT